MARVEYTQVELLVNNPYLKDVEIETYSKELEKNGRLHTTTMKKIEKIYKDNHHAVKWTAYGKRGKLLVGKKKTNPKPRIENRRGNYTEYAEAGSKLLAHYIYELNSNNKLDATFKELSMTRINWLNHIDITSPMKLENSQINYIEEDLKNLSMNIGIDETRLVKLVYKVIDNYKIRKELFYREVFSSISNYLRNEYSLFFDDKYYALLISGDEDFLSENAKIKYNYYIDNLDYTETYNGHRIKLSKDDEEDIVAYQKTLLSHYSITHKDIMWRINYEPVKDYLGNESRYLKENYHIQRLWKQKTVQNPDILKRVQYGIQKRTADRDIVREQLQKRWLKHMENINRAKGFEGLFMFYYFNKIDSLLNGKILDERQFFENYEQYYNDEIAELIELFGDKVLDVDMPNNNETLYYKILLELKGNHRSGLPKSKGA
ncbi:hypothetical protein ADIAL_1899 [Alkalibacterium sp. AK22]|uniref:hypothetical protein n=1 Tax=Alkalibacterium sp. AK22 TaxID=1229520 RepID=UPI00044C6D1E|nr:hypothetical protein [Alkalibacterium sp. AK22]EXJ22645.1 hypothetical protein ADIAL_1899 [Alkalibacterium sp. AK22]